MGHTTKDLMQAIANASTAAYEEVALRTSRVTATRELMVNAFGDGFTTCLTLLQEMGIVAVHEKESAAQELIDALIDKRDMSKGGGASLAEQHDFLKEKGIEE